MAAYTQFGYGGYPSATQVSLTFFKIPINYVNITYIGRGKLRVI